jgi:sodium-independent sulfate anion transporter 11
MGFLNFGAIVNFIGFPVFNGFTTAAAVTIATSQLRHIFGLSEIHGHWPLTVRDLFTQIHTTRYQDVLMGLACIILSWVLEKVKAECVEPLASRVRGIRKACYTHTRSLSTAHHI